MGRKLVLYGHREGGYMTGNFSVPMPRDLTNDLKLPYPIVVLSANTVCTHVILSGWHPLGVGR